MTYNFSLARSGAESYHMTVKSEALETQCELTAEDFNKVASYCNLSGKPVSLLCATLYPVRTNNLNNFSKDFFLPTLINHALKVESTAFKALAIIGAVFLDLITFPIRLLTFIPTLIVNALKPESSLHRYLRETGWDKIIERDSVEVSLLQKGIGWQKKEIHFHDFPESVFYYSDYMISGGSL